MRVGRMLEVIGSSMLLVLAFVVLVASFGRHLTTLWLIVALVVLGLVLRLNHRRVHRSYDRVLDRREGDAE